jgi:hypothetical protein
MQYINSLKVIAELVTSMVEEYTPSPLHQLYNLLDINCKVIYQMRKGILLH